MKIIILVIILLSLFNCELIEEEKSGWIGYEIVGTSYIRISYIQEDISYIKIVQAPWNLYYRTYTYNTFMYIEKINPSPDLITVSIYLNNDLIKTEQSSENIFITYP